jgi:protein-S-isoprenylcysteine O-methyltransferase Ste14
MAAATDIPGVIAPPPLLAMFAVVFGLLLDRLYPLLLLKSWLPFRAHVAIGVALAVAGGALAIAAERRFKAAGTHVPPWKPTLHLATDGVYTRLRNPMYAGMMVLVGGLGIAMASDWTLALLVPTALVLHHGAVLREERYLEARFGDDYRRYKASVKRWGIW